MNVSSKYTLSAYTLRAAWSEQLRSISDMRTVFVEFIDEDNETVVLNVTEYGWLMNYLSSSGHTIEDVGDLDNSAFGDELWAVVDNQGEVQCFGESRESERLQNIIK